MTSIITLVVIAGFLIATGASVTAAGRVAAGPRGSAPVDPPEEPSRIDLPTGIEDVISADWPLVDGTDGRWDGAAMLAGVADVPDASAAPSAVLTQARAAQVPQRPHQLAFPPGLSARLGQLLVILGIDQDGTFTNRDLRVAARRLNVDIGPQLGARDVDRLIAAHRRRVVGPARAAGIRVASQPGDAQLRRVAGGLGVAVNQVPTPRDVERLIRRAERRRANHRVRSARQLRRAGVRISARPLDGELRRVARSLGVDVTGSPTWHDVNRMVGAARSATPVFASAAGVQVHVPSRNVRLVGFHQASFPSALQMEARHRGIAPRTLPSRARATGRRSAADISVPRNTPVFAPVTGRVVEVRRYRLYGRYHDVRLGIVPDQNRRTVVTVLHVTGPTVRVGARVRAGRTTIARSATKFPFVSQIDRFAGSHPHVHIEMRRR